MSFTEPGRTPDAKLLLDIWLQWERGDVTPGATLSELKKKGLRDLLEQWAAAASEVAASEAESSS